MFLSYFATLSQPILSTDFLSSCTYIFKAISSCRIYEELLPPPTSSRSSEYLSADEQDSLCLGNQSSIYTDQKPALPRPYRHYLTSPALALSLLGYVVGRTQLQPYKRRKSGMQRLQSGSPAKSYMSLHTVKAQCDGKLSRCCFNQRIKIPLACLCESLLEG